MTSTSENGQKRGKTFCSQGSRLLGYEDKNLVICVFVRAPTKLVTYVDFFFNIFV